MSRSSVKRRARNDRGFVEYGTIVDSRGIVLRVVESSATGPLNVWLFVDDPQGVYKERRPSPHLGKREVKRLVELLNRALDDADDPGHWRNGR